MINTQTNKADSPERHVGYISTKLEILDDFIIKLKIIDLANEMVAERFDNKLSYIFLDDFLKRYKDKHGFNLENVCNWEEVKDRLFEQYKEVGWKISDFDTVIYLEVPTGEELHRFRTNKRRRR